MIPFNYFEIRPANVEQSFVGPEVYCPDLGHHHTKQLAEEAARAAGLPIFWVIYGVASDGHHQVGRFDTYEEAYETLNAILAPFFNGTREDVEDICNQSTNEMRL